MSRRSDGFRLGVLTGGAGIGSGAGSSTGCRLGHRAAAPAMATAGTAVATLSAGPTMRTAKGTPCTASAPVAAVQSPEILSVGRNRQIPGLIPLVVPVVATGTSVHTAEDHRGISSRGDIAHIISAAVA